MAHFDLGPTQTPLDVSRIAEILDWHPRRMIVGGPEWDKPLHEPDNPDSDWRLMLPFCETLANAFEHGCGAPTIGVRRTRSGDRCWTYLRGTKGMQRDELTEVNDWLQTVGRYVALRDGLCMSFALDFDRANGDPKLPQTEVGELRGRAKPYGGAQTPDGAEAASDLAARMMVFLDEMRSYRPVDCVVAMSPSDPNKPYDLPTDLAGMIATGRGLPDFSDALRTTGPRPQMKNVAKDDKLQALEGTLSADAARFAKRNVLLIDDLYQSGASANVAAMTILEAGAKRVFGLFCEKTCRNDDNVR